MSKVLNQETFDFARVAMTTQSESASVACGSYAADPTHGASVAVGTAPLLIGATSLCLTDEATVAAQAAGPVSDCAATPASSDRRICCCVAEAGDMSLTDPLSNCPIEAADCVAPLVYDATHNTCWDVTKVSGGMSIDAANSFVALCSLYILEPALAHIYPTPPPPASTFSALAVATQSPPRAQNAHPVDST